MKLFSPMKRIFQIIPILMGCFLISCENTNNDYIPYVPVNFTVDLNTFNDLTVTGFSQKYEQPGFSGVIIFCEFYDVVNPVNSIYHAYDATCTFEISNECSLTNEGNNVMGTCPCCSTKYSLFDGYPIDGQATVPLKFYNVSLMNNRLYITSK
jgi:nitrite reductase/ring-hydroxylating ferredoxin subunit